MPFSCPEGESIHYTWVALFLLRLLSRVSSFPFHSFFFLCVWKGCLNVLQFFHFSFLCSKITQSRCTANEPQQTCFAYFSDYFLASLIQHPHSSLEIHIWLSCLASLGGLHRCLPHPLMWYTLYLLRLFMSFQFYLFPHCGVKSLQFLEVKTCPCVSVYATPFS